jgi:acyl dehydratase
MENIEGLSFISSPIIITLDDVKKFCEVTGDTQQFHLSPEQAEKSFFGCLVAPGAFITSLVIKTMWEMHAKLNLFPNCEVLNLKSKVKYAQPVKIGEAITYEWKVISQQTAKFKERNCPVVLWEVTVTNQDGEIVVKNTCEFGYVC